ncbi:DUF2867 domain-containing protein [Hymenobacter chitinivorans]|uniref:Uncharacterized protein DUF2867 n=1 Tax=Hymenobacter chitinivorans DSM 11115 TaxID=1121954 RepID=A0A2M9BTE1_9BACT|nr:DUF2867 domain-containing protein [Hymenobacter chitinivorans]PJJ61219.1 uncharacterized protein DUF2867 [Hymenobacter chitinivorans DSM 11115]
MPRTAVDLVPLPGRSALAATPAHYTDAYRVVLPAHAPQEAPAVAQWLFGPGPAWVGGLMRLRDWLVRPFGLRTFPAATRPAPGTPLTTGGQLGPFRVFDVSPGEIILGQNDRHLDFRVSVLVEEAGPAAVVTTVVQFHNWFGRAYFTLIKPFHHLVVPALLRRAAGRQPAA